MGNRGRVEKKDRGLKVGENRGLKVQSPIGGTGVTHIWPIDGFDMKTTRNKNNMFYYMGFYKN